jgi:hypothetical protein
MSDRLALLEGLLDVARLVRIGKISARAEIADHDRQLLQRLEHAVDVIEGRAQTMPSPSVVRWIPDHDAPESVDDFTAHNVKTVRFERMDNEAYWFAVYLSDGTQHDFDFHLVPKRRRLNVFPRQPAPEVK